MSTLGELRRRRVEIWAIAAKYGARSVRVFGSVAREDESASSDVDLLVEFEPERSLLDLGGMKRDLETLLGRSVDIVTERGLNPRLRERILSEARLL